METRPGTLRALWPRYATSRTWWGSPSCSSLRRAGARRTTSPPWCPRPTIPPPLVEYHYQGFFSWHPNLNESRHLQQTRRLCWICNCSWLRIIDFRQRITLLAGIYKIWIKNSKKKHAFQALAAQLSEYHDTIDLADIHLLVKRKLATTQLGQKYKTFSAGL